MRLSLAEQTVYTFCNNQYNNKRNLTSMNQQGKIFHRDFVTTCSYDCK